MFATLNNGERMPCMGFGTAKIKEGVGTVLEVALKEGYRLFDCAHAYWNEAEIGKALQKCFKDGVVKREDVFITSKLVNPGHDVIPACQVTLKNLQLDYLDLYLVHCPIARTDDFTNSTQDEHKLDYNPDCVARCWTGMEECVQRGLVKSIGISNFSITKTERLLKTAKIVPAVNQVECHPYFQQQKLKDYCDKKGIVLECCYPLGGRRLQELFRDSVLQNIADKHGITVAQVCLAYGLHRGCVVIPKSVNAARIAENFKSLEVKLDEEDMRRIKEVDKNTRFLSLAFLIKPGQDPDEVIWDVDADARYNIKN